MIMHRVYNFAVGNGTSGSDNGNVASISNCNDATRSASYDYDVLNRLSHAYTTSNAGSTSWGETYTIDAVFDDTLPIADGLIEIGNTVPLPRLQAAMEDWFRRKSYLSKDAGLLISEG